MSMGFTGRGVVKVIKSLNYKPVLATQAVVDEALGVSSISSIHVSRSQ